MLRANSHGALSLVFLVFTFEPSCLITTAISSSFAMLSTGPTEPLVESASNDDDAFASEDTIVVEVPRRLGGAAGDPSTAWLSTASRTASTGVPVVTGPLATAADAGHDAVLALTPK